MEINIYEWGLPLAIRFESALTTTDKKNVYEMQEVLCITILCFSFSFVIKGEDKNE